jgi:hypothetical protein
MTMFVFMNKEVARTVPGMIHQKRCFARLFELLACGICSA